MQVSRQVVGVVAAVFLTLFGAVFYLLGRESTRRRTPTVVIAEPSEPGVAAPPMPTAAPPPSAAMPTSVAPMPTTAVAPAAASAPAVVMPSAPTYKIEPLPEIRTQAAENPIVGEAAVARDYFARMQAIQTIGTGNDPSEMANKLLTASMTGDSTGFDDLIKAAQTGADRVRAISPPACCVGYHERLLALVGDGVTMVQEIKRAMQTNDASALAALAASGSALQSRATALEAEATQIKSRLGLAR